MAAVRSGRSRVAHRSLRTAAVGLVAIGGMLLASCSSSKSSAGSAPTSSAAAVASTPAAAATLSAAATAAASSAAASSPAVAASSAAPGKTENVTMAIGTTSLGYAVAYLAQQQGYFANHGLNVKYEVTNGGSTALAAVISGSVQFVAGTASPVIQAIQKGQGFQFIAPLANEITQQWVINAATGKKWGITENMSPAALFAALKGKKAKVAVLDTGGELELLFTGEAKANGLTASDYTITTIKPYASLLAAVDRGQVDLAIVATPYGTQDVATGKTSMVLDLWGGEGPSNIAHSLFEAVFATTKYIQGHPTEVTEFNAAIGDAINLMQTQPAEALAALQKNDNYKTTDPALLKSLVGTFGAYPKSAKISMQSWNVMKSITQTILDPTVGPVTYAASVWGPAQES